MDVGDRARAWFHGRHDRICDIRIPWAHGTIVRASAHPEYYDFNLVRVEEATALEVDELLAVADEALEGLAHRAPDLAAGAAGRAGGAARGAVRRGAGGGGGGAPARGGQGWPPTGLVLLRHATGVAPGPAAPVEEVDWWDVRELRSAWHQEDFPGQPHDAYLEQSREVARKLRGRHVATPRAGRPGGHRGAAPARPYGAYLEQPRAVARKLGVRTFATRREGRLAGFADL